MQKNISLFFKGMAMGVAEVIPGVSGGTIAFITGIYEALLKSIRAFGWPLISKLRNEGPKAAFDSVNGPFLITLMAGMFTGLLAGVFIISGLLENYPEPLWAFFFGLILASSVLLFKDISHKTLITVFLLITGAALAYAITQLSPTEGSLHPLMIISSAFIAISALMLPGISGSFILLLLGMYTIIVPSVKSFILSRSIDDFMVIFYFGIGALLGLYIFSRVLTWLFLKYKEGTYAILTGFMIGALPKIWPWRNVEKVLLKNSGEYVEINNAELYSAISEQEFRVISESLSLPSGYYGEDPRVVLCIIAMLTGLFLIFAFERFSKNKNN